MFGELFGARTTETKVSANLRPGADARDNKARRHRRRPSIPAVLTSAAILFPGLSFAAPATEALTNTPELITLIAIAATFAAVALASLWYRDHTLVARLKRKAVAAAEAELRLNEAAGALSESEDRFRTLHKAFPTAIGIHYMGKFIDANQALTDQTGYSLDELRAHENLELIAEEWRDVVRMNIARGHDDPYQVVGLRKDGSQYPLEIIGRDIPYRGRILRVSELRNVTRRLDTEKALRKAKNQAEASSLAKSEFLANMSHELRTPLNAILGFTELIRAKTFGPLGSPKYDEYINAIIDAGRLQLDMVTDLLDISSIEAGNLKLVEATVDMKKLTKSAITLVNNHAKMARLSLSHNCACGLPNIRGDERRIKQILINLLTNAIKFTPPNGQVDVTVDLGANGGIRLVVSDTGIGVGPKDQERIMRPFAQVGKTFSRSHGGSGLGLPLSERLAKAHDATFQLYSIENQGTTVTVAFPPDRNIAM